MADITIIGAGITGLLVAKLFKGKNEIFEEKLKIDQVNSNASLWTIIPPLCGNYLNECEEAISFYEDLSRKYNVYYKKTYTLTDKELSKREVSESEIRELEPNIRIDSKLRKIEKSMFIEGDELITKMASELNIHFGKKVTKLGVSNNEVKYIETESGERINVERLIIAAGYWTNNLVPLDLSPFKGHLVIAKTPYDLSGIIFYKGKIIVKGKKNLYINADSVKDPSLSINYDIVKDHIAVTSQILPIVASDIKIKVGIRSVSNDGEPIVKQIYKNTVVITGYRFGFALAPYMVNKALKIIEGV